MTAHSVAPNKTKAVGSNLGLLLPSAAIVMANLSWSRRISGTQACRLSAVMDWMYLSFKASKSQGSLMSTFGALRVKDRVDLEEERVGTDVTDSAEDTALEDAPVLIETRERSLVWEPREGALPNDVLFTPMSGLQPNTTKCGNSPTTFDLWPPPTA